MIGYDTPPSVLMLPAELSGKKKGGKKEKFRKTFLKIAGTRFTLDSTNAIDSQEFDALRLLINPFGVLYAPTVPRVVRIFQTFLIKSKEESFLNLLPKKLIL